MLRVSEIIISRLSPFIQVLFRQASIPTLRTRQRVVQKRDRTLLRVQRGEESVQTVLKFLHQGAFDTPYMAAGIVSVLSAGRLDFVSRRYVDCSIRLEEYGTIRLYSQGRSLSHPPEFRKWKINSLVDF